MTQDSAGRPRVRASAYANAPSGIFHIKDASGATLRTIRGARHGQEALALYWRALGSTLPGGTMNDTLGRRIRAHRHPKHDAMQTPQLPFEEDLSAEEAASRQASAQTLAQPRRRDPHPASDPVSQTDLFDGSAGGDADEPEPSPAPSDDAPALPAPSRPEPHLLDPEEIMLQQVDARNLLPTDRADNYLYHVTNGPDAELALRQGFMVSASDPIILTERQGVSYWLSMLADDYDYILDGPASFVVLRLRRLAVEALLELDPQATRSASCPCFLLTGGAAARAQG